MRVDKVINIFLFLFLLFLVGFQQVMYGFGWIKNFALPDPYYVFPVCVGIMGLLNFYVINLLNL